MARYSIEELKSKVAPLAKRYGVGKLALFGSYARGEQTDRSDLDFVVEPGAIKSLFKFYGFADILERELGIPVDVLTYAQLPETLFMDDVLHDEVVLYEQA